MWITNSMKFLHQRNAKSNLRKHATYVCIWCFKSKLWKGCITVICIWYMYIFLKWCLQFFNVGTKLGWLLAVALTFINYRVLYKDGNPLKRDIRVGLNCWQKTFSLFFSYRGTFVNHVFITEIIWQTFDVIIADPYLM